MQLMNKELVNDPKFTHSKIFPCTVGSYSYYYISTYIISVYTTQQHLSAIMVPLLDIVSIYCVQSILYSSCVQ